MLYANGRIFIICIVPHHCEECNSANNIYNMLLVLENYFFSKIKLVRGIQYSTLVVINKGVLCPPVQLYPSNRSGLLH